MRPSVCLLAGLVLGGCPWIAGAPPGALDPDSDSDSECVDFDWDGVCDAQDACIDGIDDTVDNYLIRPGGSLPGRVCGGDDTIGIEVEAGCIYTVDVEAESTVGVELVEDSYIRASSQAPFVFSGVSASFETWDLLLFGTDSNYIVSTTAQCPSCGPNRFDAEWGDTVTARICPDTPGVTVIMGTVRPECDYGANVVTSDATTTTLYVTDDISEGSVSGETGYLSIVGPASDNATQIRVSVFQPVTAQVEQGVLIELTEYCN